MDKLLLRIADVAVLLSLSRAAVYNLITRGELPVIKIGRASRVAMTDLLKFVESKEQAAGSVSVGGSEKPQA